jgi:hypothetical protein
MAQVELGSLPKAIAFHPQGQALVIATRYHDSELHLYNVDIQ